MGQSNNRFGASSTAEEVAEGIDLTSRVIILTGANSGIGKETARVLLLRGATVIIGCKESQKTQEALQHLQDETNAGERLKLINLNLASLQSVRNFVKEFHDTELPLHILINNAGVMATPEQKTEDGFEFQFGINHLGHFLLTYLLLDDLKKSAPSRIVNVSSMAHKSGKMNFNNISLEGEYSPFKAYSQSKLANVLFTLGLAKRLEGTLVSANALHPGVIVTDLFKEISWAVPFMKLATNLTICKTIPQGAATTVYLATSPDFEGISGKYYNDCKEETLKNYEKKLNESDTLWDMSLLLCGLIDENGNPVNEDNNNEKPKNDDFKESSSSD